MPPNHGTETPTAKFAMRLPADLRDELERVATVDRRRSLANLIVFALREWLAGRGRRTAQ